MSRFIREEDVYKLFGQDGTARLHVGDIDVLPRVELREAGGQVECVGADDLVAKMKKLHPYFAISYLGFDALEHDDQIRVEQIARCIAEVARAPRVDPSKPIRARWKAFVFDEAQLPAYVCSHCGGAVKAGDDRDWCPSCGARMDLSVKKMLDERVRALSFFCRNFGNVSCCPRSVPKFFPEIFPKKLRV